MSSRGLASQRKDVDWKEVAVVGEGNPNYSGGKYIDDKGYVRLLMPDHPRNIKGYVYEHRIVIEQYLGRQLNPWESVHHINEVKCDNRVENLYLCTAKEHSAIHREGSRPTQEHRKILRDNMNERNRVMKKNPKKKALRPPKYRRLDS